MSKQVKCLAMLLAGGQGSRLFPLTANVAKPAVMFGGKYRIIDFPLSNCINSGITTVGVLTQYEPLILNEYIGNGQPWDLDRNFGGVHILSPYTDRESAGWYKGTANAIYQNLRFIRRYNPQYTLILSGDHIYKMDYQEMLAHHQKSGAACTIAVMEVPLSEAHRFGIMAINKAGFITDFTEKPARPKSQLASMGIYMFNTEVLEKYLQEDEADPDSNNDFGKNIIPNMLAAGEKLATFAFSGYWKDVGTLESLWEANMDLLKEAQPINIFADKWKIYSRNDAYPPQMVMPGAVIKNSAISEGSIIYGTVEHSIIGSDVLIEPGAVVKNSVIFGKCTIKHRTRVTYALIDEFVEVGDNLTIGGAGQLTIIGRGNYVAEAVPEGTVIEEEALCQR